MNFQKKHNRIFSAQPDYLFAIVRTPTDWSPQNLDDVPTGGEILSVHYVASFEEAYDDLLRSNKIALTTKSDKWAVIQCTAGQL